MKYVEYLKEFLMKKSDDSEKVFNIKKEKTEIINEVSIMKPKVGISTFKRGKNYDLKNLPTKIDILSIEYSIEYHDFPSGVDSAKRRALLGQTDFWDRTIRIYTTERTLEDIFSTLLHEILHLLDGELEIGIFADQDQEEEKINRLTSGIFDTFYRNGWIKFP